MTDFSYAQTTMNAWSHIRVLDLTSSLTNIYWHCLLSTATYGCLLNFTSWVMFQLLSQEPKKVFRRVIGIGTCVYSPGTQVPCASRCVRLSECSYRFFTAGTYLTSGSGKSVRASGSQYAFLPMAGLKGFSLCCPMLWGTRAAAALALKTWCLYAN